MCRRKTEMEVNIVHEKDGYALYIDDQYFGTYDSPNQAAMAMEDMNIEEENQNGSI
jgi:hypothetical protein